MRAACSTRPSCTDPAPLRNSLRTCAAAVWALALVMAAVVSSVLATLARSCSNRRRRVDGDMGPASSALHVGLAVQQSACCSLHCTWAMCGSLTACTACCTFEWARPALLQASEQEAHRTMSPRMRLRWVAKVSAAVADTVACCREAWKRCSSSTCRQACRAQPCAYRAV